VTDDVVTLAGPGVAQVLILPFQLPLLELALRARLLFGG
jgi:hypothetical protein